jgi:hypothetical protein
MSYIVQLLVGMQNFSVHTTIFVHTHNHYPKSLGANIGLILSDYYKQVLKITNNRIQGVVWAL